MRELCVLVRDDADLEDREDLGVPSPPSASGPRLLETMLPPLAGGSRGADIRISKLIADKLRSKSFFWSIELIPGTNPHLQAALEHSLEQISHQAPTFASVTWHGDHLREIESRDSMLLEHPALELCHLLQVKYGIPALMHLAAGNLKRAHVHTILEECLALGITNILALRGDYAQDVESDFMHTSDLIHYIRETFGMKFDIGVAGYPSGHPEANSFDEDILYLKKKVEIGADFILTQIITSVNEFYTFQQKCYDMGVKVPIVPGLYLIQSYNGFEKVIKTCSLKVAKNILQDLKELNSTSKERQYGLTLLQNLMQGLEVSTNCSGVHIFSMNRVSPILKLLPRLNQLTGDTSSS